MRRVGLRVGYTTTVISYDIFIGTRTNRDILSLQRVLNDLAIVVRHTGNRVDDKATPLVTALVAAVTAQDSQNIM